MNPNQTTGLAGHSVGNPTLPVTHLGTVTISDGTTGIAGPGLVQGGVAPGLVQGGVAPSLTHGVIGNPLAQGGLGTGLGVGGVGPGIGAGGVGTGLGTGVGTGLGTGLASHQLTRGTFVFKPIEARLNHDHDLLTKMDPYCKIKLGWRKGKSSVAKKEGKHPVWAGDVITLKRKHGEQFAKLKVKDRDRLSLNDRVGECKIPLDEIANKGRVSQWYPLVKGDKPAGEILIEIEYLNQI